MLKAGEEMSLWVILDCQRLEGEDFAFTPVVLSPLQTAQLIYAHSFQRVTDWSLKDESTSLWERGAKAGFLLCCSAHRHCP